MRIRSGYIGSIRTILLFIFFIGAHIAASAQNEVLYMWSGAVTSSSARVNVKLQDTSSAVRLVVSETASLQDPYYSPYKTADISSNLMVPFYIDGLQPLTKYYYAVEIGGKTDDSPDDIGSFVTFAQGAFSYSFAVGSCAKNSDHPVYDVMRKMEPLFYLNMGDLHYRDINSTNINDYRYAYEDAVLSKEAAASLFREAPIAYMWDDHDYCGNDSDKKSLGQTTVRYAYQEYVPHYPLPAGSGNVPIYQAFTVGRVRFILTDLRSERSSRTMLGDQQKLWMYNEMMNAKNNNQLIAWVSTVPYIGTYDDTWGGYRDERRELADFFRSNIDNMFILGGDAHMIAIDDGSNTDFSSGFRKNPSKYPLFQVSALNQQGSVKGGHYSHGTYPNPTPDAGQFGIVTVTDNGANEICVEFKGYRVDPAQGDMHELVNYSFCRNVGAELRFRIFPNPARNSITLQIYNSRAEQSSVFSLISMQGQEVFKKQIEVSEGENLIEIDLGDELESGIYLAKFILDNETYVTKLAISK